MMPIADHRSSCRNDIAISDKKYVHVRQQERIEVPGVQLGYRSRRHVIFTFEDLVQ